MKVLIQFAVAALFMLFVYAVKYWLPWYVSVPAAGIAGFFVQRNNHKLIDAAKQKFNKL